MNRPGSPSSRFREKSDEVIHRRLAGQVVEANSNGPRRQVTQFRLPRAHMSSTQVCPQAGTPLLGKLLSSPERFPRARGIRITIELRHEQYQAEVASPRPSRLDATTAARQMHSGSGNSNDSKKMPPRPAGMSLHTTYIVWTGPALPFVSL